LVPFGQIINVVNRRVVCQSVILLIFFTKKIVVTFQVPDVTCSIVGVTWQDNVTCQCHCQMYYLDFNLISYMSS